MASLRSAAPLPYIHLRGSARELSAPGANYSRNAPVANKQAIQVVCANNASQHQFLLRIKTRVEDEGEEEEEEESISVIESKYVVMQQQQQQQQQ